MLTSRGLHRGRVELSLSLRKLARLGFLLTLAALSPWLDATSHAAASLGTTHVDEKFGFSIRVPKDWTFLVYPDKQAYLVATYIDTKLLQPREVTSIDDADWHKPQMHMMAFTPEHASPPDTNPTATFREYTRRTLTGCYFGEEKTATINGVPSSFFDVFKERRRHLLRRVAAVYHLDQKDIAVYFEILDDWYPTYKPLFDKAFRSFKRIGNTSASSDDPVSNLGESATSTEQDHVASLTRDLPKGWIWKESRHFLVISHSDKRHAHDIGEFADALLERIQHDLSHFQRRVCSDAMPQDPLRPVIWIFATADEYEVYRDMATSMGANPFDSRRVVIFDATKQNFIAHSGKYRLTRAYDDRWVAGILGKWIAAECLRNTFGPIQPPEWYALAIQAYYESFKADRRSGCQYNLNTWIIERLRTADAKRELGSFKSLLSTNYRLCIPEDIWKLGTLVAFLRSPDGNKRPWHGLLTNYEANLNSVCLPSDDAPRENSQSKGPVVVHKLPSHASIAESVQSKAFEQTFGQWADADWQRLEEAWSDWTLK